MPPELAAPRSRRALLAAAAGTAAAFAAPAALPLTAGAVDPDPVLKGDDNATTADTSITDSGADSTAVIGNATGTGFGYGVLGTSTAAGGVVGWSVVPTGHLVVPPRVHRLHRRLRVGADASRSEYLRHGRLG